jgi:hypothetical protein
VTSPPTLALTVHAGFKCRHSGACCTAGWPIPVEAAVASAIRVHSGLPAAALSTDAQMPEGAAAVIEPLPGGTCPAFDMAGGRICTIQRDLGHEHLPASCRHFPRVALLETDAVRVTLSHFCPTAAWMLFQADAGELAIVDDATGIADRHEHDGFDARDTIPPLLRPGVAMDAETCRLWERHAVRALGSASRAPEDMLARLALSADEIRNWTAGAQSLETHARKTLAAAGALHRPQGRWGMPLPGASRLFRQAAASVPPGLPRPAMPEDAEAADRAWVQPRWTGFSRPLGRYLAARSFAAWSAYLGEGLRTQAAMLAIALAAVRIEAVRETARASRLLDAPLLHAAIRSADLLLHHLSDAPGLVKSLAGVERGPTSAYLDAIGLEAAG